MRLKSMTMRLVTVAAIFVAAVSSCAKDVVFDKGQKSGEQKLTLELGLPADTRALAGTDEDKVGDIDILAFVDVAGTYRYEYAATNVSKTITGNSVKISAEAKEYTVTQRLVVLVNSRSQLTAAGITLGMDLATALGKLKHHSAAELTDNPAGFGGFPMYAISGAVTINSGSNNFTGLSLLRSVARIDVKLNPDPLVDLSGKFQLKEAYIFNRMQYGYIPYDDAKYNSATGAVTAAHVPSDNHSGDPIVEPIKTYDAISNEIKASIYTFESVKRTKTDRLKAPAIVFGGIFDTNGDGIFDEVIKYYRADISPTGTPATDVSVDILRNHLYTIEVKDIAREGAATPKDAYLGEVTVESVVTALDLASQNVIFDKDYLIELSHSELEYDIKANNTVRFTATADRQHEGGKHLTIGDLTIESGGAGWITLTPVAGGTNVSQSVDIAVTANGSGVAREAHFWVKFGNLEYKVKVKQTAADWLTYTTNNFYLMDGDFKSLKVSSNYNWEAVIKTNPVNALASLATKKGTGANQDVWFRPCDEMWLIAGGATPTRFAETVTVTFKDPRNVCADVDVDLLCVLRAELGANCYMVNGTNTIEIPTRQVAIAMGLNDKPTVQTPSTGYLGMSWITQADYASGKLKAAVLWTDVPAASGKVVNNVTYDGKHLLVGKITVTPGTPTGGGNAVIALYLDNAGNNDPTDASNEIKWSWHIWNAGGYYPYNGTGAPTDSWMTQNLGAINATSGNAGAMGYLYQWGRKDPIVGSAATTEATLKTLYKADGTTPYTNTAWTTMGGQLLSNLVGNPSLPYGDNIGSIPVSDGTNNSWGNAGGANNSKTVFDPCPEGYRVPMFSGTTSPWDGIPAPTFSNGTGATWSTHGGYYPAAGYRDSSGLGNVGTTGYCWSASPYGTYAYYLSFKSGGVYPSYGSGRGGGFSVRCVSE